ncbi:7141_t:CDS:2, partial [Gigaspora margarita]
AYNLNNTSYNETTNSLNDDYDNDQSWWELLSRISNSSRIQAYTPRLRQLCLICSARLLLLERRDFCCNSKIRNLILLLLQLPPALQSLYMNNKDFGYLSHRYNSLFSFTILGYMEPQFYLLEQLFNEYLVNMFSQVEDKRLQFIHKKQHQFRKRGKDEDELLSEEAKMHSEVVSKLGKPTIFIIFTTNLNWPEIQQQLHEDQNYADQPYIVKYIYKGLDHTAINIDIEENNELEAIDEIKDYLNACYLSAMKAYEMPIAQKGNIEAVDILLYKLCNCNLLFGKKIFIGIGNFCQVAPVIPNAKKVAIILELIKSSSIWNKFKIYNLQQPIRDALNPEYSQLMDNIDDSINSEN